MKTLALLAAMTAPALATPEVVRFDQTAPFDPANDFVDLIDADPTAPDIRLSYFAHDPGGGSNAEVWHPQIVGVGWDAFGGNGLEVESAIGPQGYLAAGTAVPTATPGPWGVAEQDVYYGYGPDNYSLAHIGYEVFPFKSDCLSCSYMEPMFTSAEGTYYVATRWEDNSQTYYGWAAFRVEYLPYPQSCIWDDGFGNCNSWDLDSLRQLGLRFVAAGWETDPGTPIIAGAGLCPADINFDARVDFFDLSTYIAAYLAGDDLADVVDDDVLTFYDVAAFLSLYNDPCAN
jgi:hypothetical protein